MFHNIGQADKAVGIQNRKYTHHRGHHRSKHGGQSRALNTKGRKTEVSVNKQIVKNDIHCVGCHVGTHGNLRIANATLGGIDAHLNTVKDHTAHYNLKINHRAVMGFRRRAAKADNGACKRHK